MSGGCALGFALMAPAHAAVMYAHCHWPTVITNFIPDVMPNVISETPARC